MDLRGYLRAIRTGAWIIALMAVIGAGLGAAYVLHATPVYAAKLTFWVSASTPTGTSPQSTDLYLQDKATSLADLASSDRLAGMVVKTAGLKGLSTGAVASRISGAAKLNTVLFTVTVQDENAGRALAIAQAVATDYPKLLKVLDPSAVAKSDLAIVVTSGPGVGSSPISPRKTLDIGAGIAGGLVLGLLLAVLRELLDTAVRSAEQLTEIVGRPVLGQIAFDSDAQDSPLFIDEEDGFRRSEEFRQLRTNIGFLDAAEPVQVLAITSSLAAEGKSSTSANLAIVSAQAGLRVLLIEADLRRPSVSSYLGLESESGLTNVLVGTVEAEDVVQYWGRDGLTVLASGPIPPNPSELLGGARMVALIARMREEFDMIVIDSPPLLAVTDAAVLARHVDGVLLVVRHGKTKTHQVEQAANDLVTVEARVLGTVLNMRPRRGPDSSTYYDSSYYRRGSDQRALEQTAVVGEPVVAPHAKATVAEPVRRRFPRARRTGMRLVPDNARPSHAAGSSAGAGGMRGRSGDGPRSGQAPAGAERHGPLDPREIEHRTPEAAPSKR